MRVKRFNINKIFHFTEATVKHTRALSPPPIFLLFLSFPKAKQRLWYIFSSVYPWNQTGISPRCSIWSTISNWLLSCRPPDSNQTSTSGSPFCIAPQCCGAGEREAVVCFCAVTVDSSALSVITPTLRFAIRASPSSAEGQGVQKIPIWNRCPWWTYPFSCRASTTLRWYRRRSNCTSISRGQD